MSRWVVTGKDRWSCDIVWLHLCLFLHDCALDAQEWVTKCICTLHVQDDHCILGNHHTPFAHTLGLPCAP